jgi:hypothetical protein
MIGTRVQRRRLDAVGLDEVRIDKTMANGELRRCVARRAVANPVRFKECDALSGLLEEVCRAAACDSGSDHNDIDF